MMHRVVLTQQAAYPASIRISEESSCLCLFTFAFIMMLAAYIKQRSLNESGNR
jgi:hypothetical protein